MKINEFLCLFKKYMHSIPSDMLLCNDETRLREKNKLEGKKQKKSSKSKI
ncbi:MULTISPECIES: hypothetical protein [Methanobacterium]|jgi:hypothetical protein|nr:MULTISPECIES: hypothetical protein [Methanobacterium]